MAVASRMTNGIRRCPRCGLYGGKMLWDPYASVYTCINCGCRLRNERTEMALQIWETYKQVRSQVDVAERLGVPVRSVYYYVSKHKAQVLTLAVQAVLISAVLL
jgi:hypothetical protein